MEHLICLKNCNKNSKNNLKKNLSHTHNTDNKTVQIYAKINAIYDWDNILNFFYSSCVFFYFFSFSFFMTKNCKWG